MAQLKHPSNLPLLFPIKTNFTIVQLGSCDGKKISDNLNLLGSLLSECSEMYPAIDYWFKDKVIPGLRSGERIAYVAFEGEKPIASAVMKLGKHAKFCHLRIHEQFRDEDLGQMFFTQMALEARHHAKDIHFTLPEGLWASHAAFFQSFGFESALPSHHRYRSGEGELSCSASLGVVWRRALLNLPRLIAKFEPSGYSLTSDLVLSMKPQYADKIFGNKKVVEIRKSFSSKWVGKKAVIYSSHPVSSLVGEVRIGAVSRETPQSVWERSSEEIGCDYEEYKSYVGDARSVWSIELGEAKSYKTPLGLANVSHLISKDLKAPQSYCGVGLGSDWATATSVASLMHGRFR
jgi:predicted transcriptional regulator